MLLSDAFHWSQQSRPPFQTFLTKKTSQLSINVGLDGCGTSSPANNVPVFMSIPACCGYTYTLSYVSTTVLTRSHVSYRCWKYQSYIHVRYPSSRGRSTSPDCTPILPNKYLIPGQISSPSSSDATRLPVRPVAIVIVVSASAS